MLHSKDHIFIIIIAGDVLKQRSKSYQIKEEWFWRSLLLQFLSLSDPTRNPCFAKSVSILSFDFRAPDQLLHPFLCPSDRHFSRMYYTAPLQSQLSPSTVLQAVNPIHYQTLCKKCFQPRMWTDLLLYWNAKIKLTFRNCPQHVCSLARGSWRPLLCMSSLQTHTPRALPWSSLCEGAEPASHSGAGRSPVTSPALSPFPKVSKEVI